jgi:hypothetical protein
MRRTLRPWLAAVACGCGLSVGCESPPTGPDVESLKAVVELYAQYAASHQGKPPAGEADLRKFLVGLEGQARAAGEPPAARGTRYDAYFVSTRDGKPFVIRYGTPVSYDPKSTEVLAAEAVGIGGKRFVAYANGTVLERAVGDDPVP